MVNFSFLLFAMVLNYLSVAPWNAASAASEKRLRAAPGPWVSQPMADRVIS